VEEPKDDRQRVRNYIHRARGGKITACGELELKIGANIVIGCCDLCPAVDQAGLSIPNT
jgi:hypothetical protein